MGLGAVGLAVPVCLSQTKLSADEVCRDRPNIILIMADDMGYSDIGCYGGEIQTSNLNELAEGGARFTQFYNTARCCPTRASLMTGLYQHQAGVGHMVGDYGHDGYRGDLNNRCVTIAEVLKPAGYWTYMSGKWHVTRHIQPWSKERKDDPVEKHNWPLQRGFDRFYGTITGAGSFYNPPTLVRGNTPITAESEDFYYTDAISDKAVRFIDEHIGSKPDKPFFCYVAYTSPHWPLHAPAETVEKYRGKYDKGWDQLRSQRYERMVKMGLINSRWPLTERDENVPPWEKVPNKQWQARRMEVYVAQVEIMDEGIGRITEALKRNGKLDNTLILFLADNGGCAEELRIESQWVKRYSGKDRAGRPIQMGNDPDVMPGPENTFQSYGRPWANASNTPFRLYKHWVHEGGIATPLIAYWPAGIKARGKLRHQPGHLIDIMATCVDVAGAKYPAQYKGNRITPMEGRSLTSAFDNEPIEREAIYWEHEGNRAVRKGNWKLVSKHPGGWELYDMEADRTELNNLAGKNPQKVAELRVMYESWAQRAGVQPWPVKRAKKKKKS
jgi:arylsulfatase